MRWELAAWAVPGMAAVEGTWLPQAHPALDEAEAGQRPEQGPLMQHVEFLGAGMCRSHSRVNIQVPMFLTQALGFYLPGKTTTSRKGTRVCSVMTGEVLGAAVTCPLCHHPRQQEAGWSSVAR